MRIVVKDLSPGASYNLQFRSKAADGEVSEWSATYPVTISTQSTPPRAPTGVTLDVAGDSFRAKWSRVTHSEDGSPATDLTGYVVQFRNVTTNQTASFETTDTNFELTFNLNFALFSPIAGHVGVKVAARNNLNIQSEWSDEAIAQNPPPGPVRNLVATGIIDAINMTWEPPANLEDDFKEYRAYISYNNDFDTHQGILVWSGVATTAQYHTMSYGQDFYVNVVAVDKFELESSAVVSGPVQVVSSTRVDVDPPPVPGNVSGEIDAYALTVNWDAVANDDNDLAGYQVGYRPAGATAWMNVTVSHDELEAVIQPITRFTDYDVRVRAFDFSFNYSLWTAITLISGETSTPPAKPTGVQFKGAITSAMIVWSPNSEDNIAHYQLQFEDRALAEGDDLFITSGNNMSFSENVSQDTVYYSRVRAVNAQGLKSPWSDTVTGTVGFLDTPDPTDGNPPASSPAAKITAGVEALYVSWPAVANADPVTYDVYISTTSGFTPAPATLYASTAATAIAVRTLADDTPLAQGTDYYVRLIARDADGAAAPGAQATSKLRKIVVGDTENIRTDGVSPASSPRPTVRSGIKSIFATWAAVANADPVTYEVHLGTTTSFSPTASTRVGETTGTMTTIQRLPNGNDLAFNTNYYVRLIAKDADGAAPVGTASLAVQVTQIPNSDLDFDPVAAGIPQVFHHPTVRPATANAGSIYYGPGGTMQIFQDGAWVDIPVATQDDLSGQFANAIIGSVIQYAVNSSETNPPTTGWSTSTPTREPGSFVWFRSVVNFGDGSSETSNPALLTGNTGIPGDPGASAYTWLKYADTPTSGMSDSPDGKTYMGIAYNKPSPDESENYSDYTWSLIRGAEGKGISTTVVNYAKSTNGTAAPTSGWDTTIPATVAGEYLWTRTVTTYTDDTTSTAYGVARHGATGGPGAAGRGITGTTVTYQKSNSGTAQPTTWLTTIPATNPGEWLWTKTTTTYTSAPLTVDSFSVAKHGETGQQGIPGEPGADGTTTYTWVKYAPNGSPTAAQMSDSPAGMTHIGLAFNKTTATESTVPTEYAWSLIQGAEGSDGVSITSIVPFYRTVTKGADAPTQPSGTGNPSGWTTTEPNFVINTELYRTERILYSNNTASWTPVTKVAAYQGIDQVNTVAITADRRVRKDNRAPVVADGAGAPDGALWLQYGPATEPGTGTVLTQTWEWNGSTWQPRGIDRTFIPQLDIGSGTFGDLTGDRLIARSITADKIGANEITANEIAAQTITAAEIVAGTIGATEINVDSLVGNTAWLNTLVTSQAFIDNAKINSANITGTLTIGQLPNEVATADDVATAQNAADAAQNTADNVESLTGGWTFPNTTEINGGAIRTRSITAEQLEADIIKVGTTLIEDGAITTELIAANAITADLIDADAIEARHIKAGSITIGVGAPIAPGVVATPGDVGDAVAPINTRISDWTTPGFTTIEGGKITTGSISADSIKTEEIAADHAFITNLRVTTANITDLTFDKIEGGSGIIHDLTIKSVLTIGDTWNPGAIQSHGYSANQGVRIDNTGIVVNSGSISAAALNINVGNNLLPAAYADFEFDSDFYTSGISHSGCYYSVGSASPSAKYNDQRLSVTTTTTGSSYVFFAPTMTTYNVQVEGGKTYIASMWVARGSTATTQVQIRPRFNTGAYGTGAVQSITASANTWTRISQVFTVSAGVTAMNLSAWIPQNSVTVHMDGIQIEEKTGSTDEPSSWSPPSSTTIDGGMIRTGEIRSTAMVPVGFTTQPAWSLNTSGGMQVGSAEIRGGMVVGAANNSASTSSIQSGIYRAATPSVSGAGFLLRSDGYADFQNININMIGTASKLIAGTSMDGERTEISNAGMRYYGNDPDYTDAVSEFGYDMRIMDVTSPPGSDSSRGSIWGIDNVGSMNVATASINEDPEIAGTALLGTLASQLDEVDLDTPLGFLDRLSFSGNVAQWDFDSTYPWTDFTEKTVGEIMRDQQAGRAVGVFLTARVRFSGAVSSTANAYELRIRKTEVDLGSSTPTPSQPTTTSSLVWDSGAVHMASTQDVFTSFMGLHIPSRSERARWLVTIRKASGSSSFRVDDMRLVFIDMGPIPDVRIDTLDRRVADAATPPTPVTPKKQYTSRWYANSIRRAQGSYVTSTNDRPGQVLQGWDSSMNGDPFHTILRFTGTAHYGETGRTITQALSGVPNSDIVRMRLRVTHFAGWGNVTAKLGIQSSSTAIPTINQTSTSTSPGQTTQHTLNSTIRNAINSSGMRYITFGPGGKTSQTYASYHGTSGGNSKRVELEIVYKK